MNIIKTLISIHRLKKKEGNWNNFFFFERLEDITHHIYSINQQHITNYICFWKSMQYSSSIDWVRNMYPYVVATIIHIFFFFNSMKTHRIWTVNSEKCLANVNATGVLMSVEDKEKENRFDVCIWCRFSAMGAINVMLIMNIERYDKYMKKKKIISAMK